MKHPFEGVPAGRRRAVMIALLLAIAPVMAAMLVIDRALPCGIIDFELCAFRGSCDTMLAAYRSAELLVGLSIGLDYLFLLLYAATLGAALVFTAARRSAGTQRAARWLAWGATLAAGLDAVENVALYHMIASGTAAAQWLAGITAAIKFALVVAAIGSLLVIALRRKPAA